MKLKPKITIADYFDLIEDRQVERTKQHKLIDIITIAICAVICGADSWVRIETYGKAKYKWFARFLELPNGIPERAYICSVVRTVKSPAISRMFYKMDSIDK